MTTNGDGECDGIGVHASGRIATGAVSVAVVQGLECSADVVGDPDRVAFPLQATVGESAWVGSVVLNTALVSVVVIAVVLLHCVALQS